MRFDGKKEKGEKKLFIHKNWESHERGKKEKNKRGGGKTIETMSDGKYVWKKEKELYNENEYRSSAWFIRICTW